MTVMAVYYYGVTVLPLRITVPKMSRCRKTTGLVCTQEMVGLALFGPGTDDAPETVRTTFTDERWVGPLASFVHNLLDTNSSYRHCLNVATTVDPDFGATSNGCTWSQRDVKYH
jgi:hypothetical protein